MRMLSNSELNREGGSRLRRLVFVLLASGTVAAAPALAQPVGHGDEFVANDFTTGSQYEAAVALGENGQAMAIWRSTHGSDPEGVYARHFTTRGTPIAGQFQANSYTTSIQWKPSIAAGSAGDFILVWESDGSPGDDDDSFSIQARLFDGGTSTLGTQFQVNNLTAGTAYASAVAADAAGNFVIVWTSAATDGDDENGSSIQARLFNAAGTPLANQFQVNTTTVGDQQWPAVARNASGQFVVVWQGAHEDGAELDILGQRYDADGDPVGGELLLNSLTANHQGLPGVGIGADGSFLAAWESYVSDGDDDDQTSVQARWFDADGVPAGPESQVNTFTTSFQNQVAVAGRGDGFVVTWRSLTVPGDDLDQCVQARRFDATGNPVEAPFQVNVYTTGTQGAPAVGLDTRGNFFVAYESWGGALNGENVLARSYDALFRDDFEGGDPPSRWTTSP